MLRAGSRPAADPHAGRLGPMTWNTDTEVTMGRRANSWTRKSLIAALRDAAARNHGDVAIDKFMHQAGIGKTTILRHFVRGWRELREAAGLSSAHACSHPWYADEHLLEQLDAVIRELKRWPTWNELQSRTGISRGAMNKHFGSAAAMRTIYNAWKENPRAVPLRKPPDDPRAASFSSRTAPRDSRREKRYIVTGDPCAMYEMTSAPINETGVILLFGMMCRDLDFRIDSVQQGFPDCDARRLLPGDPRLWQRLRIEFEYRSSNFRVHKHDPAGCDLIVCWEHDWPQSPVGVLELRRMVRFPSGAEKLCALAAEGGEPIRESRSRDTINTAAAWGCPTRTPEACPVRPLEAQQSVPSDLSADRGEENTA